MSYQIDVLHELYEDEDIDRAIEVAISTTLQKNRILSAALTILLTGDNRMRQLNRDFRDLDSSTDVLSFPSGELEGESPEDIQYLGDIAISVPTAQRQAQTKGHSYTAELQLLAVHGVLHLLGHDHHLPEEKTVMWTAQAEIMEALGLQHIEATEE